MRLFAVRYIAVVLVLLSLPWVGSCGGDAKEENPQQRLQALVDEACLRTQVGRYDDVDAIIAKGEKIKGAESMAAYGKAVMKALSGLNKLAYIMAAGRSAVGGAFQTQAAQDGDLTGILHKFFQDLEDTTFETQQALLDTVAKYPNGSLILNDCVAYFGETPIFSLRGELDANDLRFMAMLFATGRGALNVLLAQDFGVDVLGAVEIVSRLSNEPLCQPDMFADKRCIMQILAWVIDRYPRFLAINSPGGKEAYLRSREAVQVSFQMLVELVNGIDAEKDDQSNDFLVIEDPKRDGQGNLTSFTVVFQNYGTNPVDVSWFSNSFFESRRLVYRAPESLSRTEVKADETFVADVQLMRDHFEKGGGPVDFRSFLLAYSQVLAPILEASFKDQADALLDGYDPDGAIRSGLTTAGINYSDFVNIIFRSVLPRDFVFADFYGFTGNPVPLRAFLPRPDFVDPLDGRKTLAMEWECGNDETVATVCQTTVTDQAHFSAYPYAFEADGVADRFAYISMIDPSIGGYLRIDPAMAPQTTSTVKLPARSDGPERAAGAVVPDDYIVNYAIHRMGAYLITLVEEVEQ